MDRITLDVIGAALLAIAEEMGEALIKSSYSTNIKERQDCSTALFNVQGEVIAQAEHIPMHLGSLIMIIHEILRRYCRKQRRACHAIDAIKRKLSGWHWHFLGSL